MDTKTVFPGWTTVRLIGRGSFGAVYEIERDVFGEKEKAALKLITIPQSENDIEELLNDGYDEKSITARFQSYLQDIVREYSLMAAMKGCANIVYCDDVKYVQHDNGMGWDIFIKMELLTALPRALGAAIPEEKVLRIGTDICSALAFCEKRHILHRDIKPQNIFVAPDGTYKLGDFGIAKTAERTTSGTKTGTYKYMAPEVYNNRPYGGKADIYSLGLVLYWLLNDRRTPFLPLPPTTPSSSDEDKARARRFSGEPIPAPAHGSEELRRIVLKACAFDPAERYQSAEEMLRELERLSGKRTDEKDGTVSDGSDGTESVGTVGVWGSRAAVPQTPPRIEKRLPAEEKTVSSAGQKRPESRGKKAYCRQCGAPLDFGTKYCTRCGASQTEGGGSRKWLYAVLALAALAVLAAAIVIGISLGGGGSTGGGSSGGKSKTSPTPRPTASASVNDETTPEPASEPAEQPVEQPAVSSIVITKDLIPLFGPVGEGKYNLMFKVVATGDLSVDSSFDWQRYNPSASSWVSIVFGGDAATNEQYGLRIYNYFDAKEQTYTSELWANGITQAAAGAYRCVITDANGFTATSSEAAVAVDPAATPTPEPTPDSYQTLIDNARAYNSALVLPTRSEMLDQPVTMYVKGTHYQSKSGGIFLRTSPDDTTGKQLPPHTEVTVYAVHKGSLESKSGQAFVKTKNGQYGWTCITTAAGTEGLSATDNF